MIKFTSLVAIILIICFFALFNDSTIAAIYNQTGMLLGISSDWTQTRVILISNIGHILAYCTLFSFISIFYKLGVIISFSLVFSIACTIEFLQLLTLTRQFSFADIAYNLIGIAIGCTLLILWSLGRQNRQELFWGTCKNK
ncbi:MAG: hypothetical protein COA36_07415 [Desulfotalea sp.]|nr:MAG: hypothetical protein COA36_07415 [Desulfotalea sp.]